MGVEELKLRAKTLIEALPYIRQFRGTTLVVKLGGNAMAGEDLRQAFMQDIVLLRSVGMNPVVVHGGGPQVSRMMQRLGKEPAFVNGLRVTDAETMEIVEMVLAGKLNKDLVAQLESQGGRAVGLSGKDGGLVRARKASAEGPDGPVDLGFVGEVEAIDGRVLLALARDEFIPVICSIGVGADGRSYNINADHVAGRLAGALGATKLLLLTDVPGVMRRPEDPTSVISVLTVSQARQLLSEDVIGQGMIPKIAAAIDAVVAGTDAAHIIDGRIPHALLMEIFTDEGIGTMIVPDL